MNKYIIGGILSGIAMLVIYGATSSDRVVRWMDGEDRTEADFVSYDSSDQLIAQVDDENLTPLQKAGNLPQRQTFAQPTQSDDITAAPANTPEQPADTQTPTEAQPSTTEGQGLVETLPEADDDQPIQAYW
ncbi:MAG: hypothetical protein F6J97_01975 [Leptolyngbya sp. SIO4C1]|nr:hypothetical protein [Leptolyngbya sp. SIO4C1]